MERGRTTGRAERHLWIEVRQEVTDIFVFAISNVNLLFLVFNVLVLIEVIVAEVAVVVVHLAVVSLVAVEAVVVVLGGVVVGVVATSAMSMFVTSR